MNWMRCQCPCTDGRDARASVVLPTPGTSSSRRWPSAKQAGQAERDDLGLALQEAVYRACDALDRGLKLAAALSVIGLMQVRGAPRRR